MNWLQSYHAGELPLERVTASVQGWVAHVSYGQTYGLRKQIFGEIPLEPRRRSALKEMSRQRISAIDDPGT